MRKDIDLKKDYIIKSLLNGKKTPTELCLELNCKPDTLRSRYKKWIPEYKPNNTKKLSKFGGQNKWNSLEEYVLSRGNKCRRSILHRLLVEKNGDYCFECGIASVWNEKYLRMQVDHIDGLCYNNEVSNLRLLCPNCHSQTETFCGRNSLAQMV